MVLNVKQSSGKDAGYVMKNGNIRNLIGSIIEVEHCMNIDLFV